MVAVWQFEQVGGTKADVVAFLLFIASSHVVTRDLNTMRYFSKHNALDTSIGLIPNIMQFLVLLDKFSHKVIHFFQWKYITLFFMPYIFSLLYLVFPFACYQWECLPAYSIVKRNQNFAVCIVFRFCFAMFGWLPVLYLIL